MIITTIEATDIPDAWFQCVNKILDVGFLYEIQQGSNVRQTRMEFDHITILIKFPYKEPYDLMLPQIPEHFGIPNPVELGYIEQYLPYIMTGESRKVNEDYTYGESPSSYAHNPLPASHRIPYQTCSGHRLS